MIGRRADKSIYYFQLQDSESRIRQITDLAREELSDGKSEATQECYTDALKDMTHLPFEMAAGTGTAIDFENGTIRKGFLYLDGSLQPFEQVGIHSFQMEGLCWYVVAGNGWQAELVKCGEMYISQVFSYNLSGYPDVADRLYRFEKIRKYIRANQASVRIFGDETGQFSYRIPAKLPDWRTGQVCRKESCRYLPGIPMKYPGIRRRFQLTQEVILNDGSNLPELDLFGFVFRPVAQYILPGTFV